jgi:hypothetical protein
MPLARAAGHAALAVHKGMGARPAGLLLAAGVTDVRALGASDPRRLHARLADLSRARGEIPPRPEAVAVWVLAARGHQRPRR